MAGVRCLRASGLNRIKLDVPSVADFWAVAGQMAVRRPQGAVTPCAMPGSPRSVR